MKYDHIDKKTGLSLSRDVYEERTRALKNALTALTFARSQIKAGESWTSKAQEIIGNSISELVTVLCPQNVRKDEE